MRSAFLIASLLTILAVGLAFSDDTSGKFGVTLYGGYHMPEMLDLDDDVSYGGSFTYHFLPWLYGEINVMRFREHLPQFTKIKDREVFTTYVYGGEKYPGGSTHTRIDTTYDSVLTRIIPVDFNVGFSLLKDKKVNPYLSVGATYFNARIDELPDMNDVAWGFNGAAGAEFFLAKLFEDRADLSFIMDVRYRWGKANFGLGYTSKEEEITSFDEGQRLEYDRYTTYELEDHSDDFDLGGISATAGLRIYF